MTRICYRFSNCLIINHDHLPFTLVSVFLLLSHIFRLLLSRISANDFVSISANHRNHNFFLARQHDRLACFSNFKFCTINRDTFVQVLALSWDGEREMIVARREIGAVCLFADPTYDWKAFETGARIICFLVLPVAELYKVLSYDAQGFVAEFTELFRSCRSVSNLLTLIDVYCSFSTDCTDF